MSWELRYDKLDLSKLLPVIHISVVRIQTRRFCMRTAYTRNAINNFGTIVIARIPSDNVTRTFSSKSCSVRLRSDSFVSKYLCETGRNVFWEFASPACASTGYVTLNTLGIDSIFFFFFANDLFRPDCISATDTLRTFSTNTDGI